MTRPSFRAERYYHDKDHREFIIGYRLYRHGNNNDMTLACFERHTGSMDTLRPVDQTVSINGNPVAVFFCPSPSVIPQEVEEHKNQLVRSKQSEGFKYTGKVLVDPKKGEIIPVDPHMSVEESAASEEPESLSWHLLPPSLNEDDKYLLRQILWETFVSGADKFGFDMTGHGEAKGGLPSSLMRTEGFELSVKPHLGSNSIDPNRLDGAGELRNEHGYKPLLMMLYLQKRLKENLPSTGESLLQMADSNGLEITFDRFNNLQPLIEKMGFNFGEVRKDAVKLGLAEEIIDLSTISITEDNFYF